MAKHLTGYRFLDKDPTIDLYREAKRKSGVSDEDIYLAGGPTTHTLRMWDLGETRKPQRLSMVFAMKAMGYNEQWANQQTGDILKTTFKIPKDHLPK